MSTSEEKQGERGGAGNEKKKKTLKRGEDSKSEKKRDITLMIKVKGV